MKSGNSSLCVTSVLTVFVTTVWDQNQIMIFLLQPQNEAAILFNTFNRYVAIKLTLSQLFFCPLD